MLTKFKVLTKDLKSPFMDFQYEIGKWYKCEDFNSDIKKDCSNGFYATDIEGLTSSFNIDRCVFECEVKGKEAIYDIFKQRYEFIKIIRQCSFEEVKKLAKKKEDELGYKLSEVLFPINPLLQEPKLDDSHKELLLKWASVSGSVSRGSVGDSVRDSVGVSVFASVSGSVGASVSGSVSGSVRDSVGVYVWDFVCGSVWFSVRDSVWAYISSLFPNIKKWKYIEHIEGINPFQSCIDLWRSGFVPSYDGKTWRLHAGKDAKIVYEMKDI